LNAQKTCSKQLSWTYSQKSATARPMPKNKSIPASGLSQSSMGTPNPTPTRPSRRRIYELIADRSLGVCEICGLHSAAEICHRVHRSHSTMNTVENLLHVCRWDNHTGCHGGAHTETTRYKRGWAVRSYIDPASVPVLYRGYWVYLNSDSDIVDVDLQTLVRVEGGFAVHNFAFKESI